MMVVIPMWAVWVGIGFGVVSIIQTLIQISLAKKKIALMRRRMSITVESKDSDKFVERVVRRMGKK